MPALVLTAHGTANPAGQQVVRRIAEMVRVRLPQVSVQLAYVDVQAPQLEQVLDDVAPRLHHHEEAAVVVPLLLAQGYHVEVDIATAASARAGVVVTAPVGPDPRLARVLYQRLQEAGVGRSNPVVLGVAGSSRPQARLDAEVMRAGLQSWWAAPVTLGFATATGPRLPQALVQATAAHPGVEIGLASYLLGPGFFFDRFKQSAAQVADPLGAHPLVAEIVAERYREAVALLAEPPMLAVPGR